MIRQDLKKFNLPDAPGVYYFLGPKPAPSTKHLGPRILYIGKATSLRDRVKSYFLKDLLLTRGPLIEKMVEEVKSVKFVRTDSVLEALMLEVSEIKKYQPPYNTKEKDDRSYNYVIITKEAFPKVLTVRGSELKQAPNNKKQIPNKSQEPKFKIAKTYGPFPHGNELKEALKIIRKIFPFRDKCIPCSEQLQRKSASGLRGSAGCKPCFNYQIGLCPGPCAGVVSKAEYKKTIRNLKMFFEGNKPKLVQTLEKEMNSLAKNQKFEEAEKVKRTLYALEHIQDIAMIKADMSFDSAQDDSKPRFRIEAYDIAHISGTDVVGVMTVVVDGELDKSQYRKFKLRGGKGNNDVANLREVLERRFNHPEWRYPDMIVVDGGKAQINTAEAVQKEIGVKIPVVSVVKDERHRPKEILWQSPRNKRQPARRTGTGGETREREILMANAEAHRFAIKYHRRLRNKGFRV